MAEYVVGMENSTFDLMNNFPVEIRNKIFSYLDEKDLFCCSAVCPLWSSIIDFYGTHFGGQSASHARILDDRVKFYNGAKHLKTIHFKDQKIEEIVRNCLIIPHISKLNRVDYRRVCEYDVGKDFSSLPPSLVPTISLTHLYLVSVQLSKSGFIQMCHTLGHCLQHLVLWPNNEIFVDEAGLSEGLALLKRIEHLDASQLIIKSQENGVTNDSNFLQALALNCPNLRDLSIPKTFNEMTSATLVQFLKSDNTKLLRFLSIAGCNAIDDGIDEGLQYRLNFFKQSVPKLTIFANQNGISNELLAKYSPTSLQYYGIYIDTDESPGSILINRQEDEWVVDLPFMKFNVKDWSLCEDDYQLEELNETFAGSSFWDDFFVDLSPSDD